MPKASPRSIARPKPASHCSTTGDFYGMGHNEMLIRRALEAIPRSRVVISVKFGALRDPAGGWGGNDGRPQAVKNFLAYTLRRLGTRPTSISIVPRGSIRPYRSKILSGPWPIWSERVTCATSGSPRRALKRSGARTRCNPIADLQIEYSLMSRGIEAAILPTLRELGIAVTAYGVLSRGLLSGRIPAAGTKGDIRVVRMPRFQQGNLERNLTLVDSLRQIGNEKGASPGQLAIAWVRSRGLDIVPLVGARRREQLKEALGAFDLNLSADDLARIDDAVQPSQDVRRAL